MSKSVPNVRLGQSTGKCDSPICKGKIRTDHVGRN
jgi:hypothetical protein